VDGDGLRKRLRRARSGGRGRYPLDLRKAVVEYASRARQRGTSGAKVAAELGMSSHTLQYWQAAARGHAQLLPVKVVADATATQEVIIECGLVRVRGLDIAGVAELLKRLA
jgi:transposase-like protein